MKPWVNDLRHNVTDIPVMVRHPRVCDCDIPVMVHSCYEFEVLLSIRDRCQGKRSLTMRWSIDTDPLVRLHAKP